MQTTHPLLEKAQQWNTLLLEKAQEHEKNRRVSPQIAKQLAQQGFFQMLVPAESGGLELEPTTFVEVLEELAKGDAASAWIVMTGSTTGILSATMQEAGAHEIWKQNPDVVTAGIFAPMGKATPTEGGYLLSGRWPFASGCENSDWIMGGALIFEDGNPRLHTDGSPKIVSMFFPQSSARIIDTWEVSGLCGTGSHDISVKELFIPQKHTTSLFGDSPRVANPLYTFPVFGLLSSGIAAVALGIARAAIEHLKTLTKAKKIPGSRRTLADQSLTQLQVAQAEATLQAARVFLLHTLHQIYHGPAQSGDIQTTHKAHIRLAATHAVQACTQAIDAMYQLGGGSSLYQTCPLQRHFRDIHTITQHIMVSQQSMTLAGRVLLQLDCNTSQL